MQPRRPAALGCTVRVIDVEKLGLPPKGDAVDWLKANSAVTAVDIGALPCVDARRRDDARAEAPAGGEAGPDTGAAPRQDGNGAAEARKGAGDEYAGVPATRDSEAGIAQAFTRQHGDDWRYVAAWRLYGGPYLELFARQRGEGWDAWGDDV